MEGFFGPVAWGIDSACLRGSELIVARLSWSMTIIITRMIAGKRYTTKTAFEIVT